MGLLRNLIRHPLLTLAGLFCVFCGVAAEILLLNWARELWGLLGGIAFFILQIVAVVAMNQFGRRVDVIDDEQGGER